ncbi:MAG TPA: FAD-binding oxidoreductase [Candidatus Thermoplasmatota archaeon]
MTRDLVRALCNAFPRRVVLNRFPLEPYAHDAGMQWEEPLAVATPGTEADVAALVRWCASHDVPITGRGAGSSIAGNAIGSGLVVDFSRRMRRILHYDVRRNTVTVEAGVVLARLNRFLRARGRRIGPSPSSEAFCTIGGMVGNNAAGSHSLLYGATAENVASLRAVRSDGEFLEWRGPAKKPRGKLQEHLFSIAKRFRSPWPNVAKNSSGYLLDRLGNPGAWHPQRIFCGAEGTLGLVSTITLRTHPIPRTVATLLLGFPSTEAALESVLPLLSHAPAAVELVDEAAVTVLHAKHPALRASADASACSLVVDLFGRNPSEVRRRTAAIQNDAGVEAENSTVAYASRDRDALWTARRDVEPVLRELPGRRRPLPFVEDVVVPVDRQVSYVRDLQRLLTKHGLLAPLYGHAGEGNLHVRPFVDLRNRAERETMQQVNRAVARLAKRHGGSLTGEHGDGYLRSSLVRRLFPEAHRRFEEVKELFDPEGLFNPGKVVETRRTSNVRLFLDGPRYTTARWS